MGRAVEVGKGAPSNGPFRWAGGEGGGRGRRRTWDRREGPEEEYVVVVDVGSVEVVLLGEGGCGWT